MRFLRGHWQLVLVTGLIFALWSTPVNYPLRMIVVFLHEISHVLSALLTGGSVDSLTLDPAEGGRVMTRGGNLFLTLTSGYLGSLVVGIALFFIALHTHLDRWVTALFGGGTLLIAAVFVRDGFALVFCALTGISMLLMARFLPLSLNDLVLRVIGLSSMLYVPQDIISDTITRSHLRSDARLLAEAFGGATILWGGLWLAISLAVIGLSLRYGLGPSSTLALRRKREGTRPDP
ncbi:MAG: M50 family metallopeptidase [Tabrizicola sp.]|nr:M50 family metallopeptidase [Tabrizicola sp.]